jgi:hypothetical protein
MNRDLVLRPLESTEFQYPNILKPRVFRPWLDPNYFFTKKEDIYSRAPKDSKKSNMPFL